MSTAGSTVAALTCAAFFNLSADSAVAQGRPAGWSTFVDGLALYRDDADLSGGGTFSSSRVFLRGGGLYRFDSGASAGLVFSVGESSYTFSNPANQPWSDVRNTRISAPIAFALQNDARILVVPQVQWAYERGAGASEGRTYGVFAGISWQVNDSLRIGPAFGAFSQLDDDTLIFPAILVDWQIADRWTLSTANAPGATQGPGLGLSYDWSDVVSVSLSARSERSKFRLDGSGPAPGGTGEDRSIPVVLSLDFKPSRAVSFNVFAGVGLDGELRLNTAAGAEVSRQGYSTAAVAGFAFRARF